MLLSVLLAACNEKSAPDAVQFVDENPVSGTVVHSADSCKTEIVADDILSRTIYTSADSLRVVNLLRTDVGDNDVLYYARQFIGTPYVASTLEISDPERLVVNLRELDCTTLVETVLALSMTKRQGSDNFSDYCRNLMRLRYWKGEMDGYLSRLHYFTWWMHDNLEKGIISEVIDNKYFSAPIKVNNFYMSAHPEKYRFLKGHRDRVDSIAKLEKKYNGADGYYLPQQHVGLNQKQLSTIENGDLVAIVTSKQGLDYSHLGFAVWGKDGLLHLLNASSIHHRVVEESKTLRRYLNEHPSSVGIRLFRLK